MMIATTEEAMKALSFDERETLKWLNTSVGCYIGAFSDKRPSASPARSAALVERGFVVRGRYGYETTPDGLAFYSRLWLDEAEMLARSYGGGLRGATIGFNGSLVKRRSTIFGIETWAYVNYARGVGILKIRTRAAQRRFAELAGAQIYEGPTQMERLAAWLRARWVGKTGCE